MRMVDGVHRNTSNLGPLLLLSFDFMVNSARLQNRLVSSASASDNADGSSAIAVQGLSGSGRQSHSGL